ELLGRHDCARAEPQMTVDSEPIFAVAAHSRSDARALEALEGAMAAAWIVEHYCDVKLRKRQVGEGTLLVLARGEIAAQHSFRPKRYVEPDPLPAVRAPGEREHCLSQLAALATG